MDKKILKKIEKLSSEFFKKMSFEVDVQGIKIDENTVCLEVNTKEPQILIGEKGKTLIDLQKVLGKILRKQTEQMFYIDLDINQYKKSKADYLKGTARDLADKVALSGREKILFPMSSYERRIVHLELSKRQDIKTESIGEEPYRKVVIRPA